MESYFVRALTAFLNWVDRYPDVIWAVMVGQIIYFVQRDWWNQALLMMVIMVSYWLGYERRDKQYEDSVNHLTELLTEKQSTSR